jgi:glycosyltransferase involved in cell wall biosynthesis
MSDQVSVGIFAHNEERAMERVLRGLREQTLFSRTPTPRLVVLENGSTDRTADAAREALERLFGGLPTEVRQLEVGDKGETWNRFVHEISPRDDVFLVFVDADIEFGAADALERLVATLRAQPGAWVAVSRPVKDIARKERRSGVEKLSLAGSAAGEAGPAQLCGSLYCGRTEALRRIAVPRNLLVEDGFLRAAMTTDMFREPEAVDRIVRAPGAFHYFEAVTNLRHLHRHEKRLAIGTEMNIMLFDWARGAVRRGADVAGEIERRNAADPEWVRNMVRERFAEGRFAFHSAEYVFRKYRTWKLLPPGNKVKSFPGFAAQILMNAAATLAARRALRAGRWRW